MTSTSNCRVEDRRHGEIHSVAVLSCYGSIDRVIGNQHRRRGQLIDRQLFIYSRCSTSGFQNGSNFGGRFTYEKIEICRKSPSRGTLRRSSASITTMKRQRLCWIERAGMAKPLLDAKVDVNMHEGMGQDDRSEAAAGKRCAKIITSLTNSEHHPRPAP